MVNYEEIGRRIKKYREECGMTQADLAEAAAVSITQISRDENAHNKISLDRLSEYAFCLGIPPQQLFADTNDEDKGYLTTEILSGIKGWSKGEKELLLEFIELYSQKRVSNKE